MKYYAILFLALINFKLFAQVTALAEDTSWKAVYRATAPKINDLVHTKVEVSFDYEKSIMYGKATLTIHPHFYATDTLSLDAKGMTIEQVGLVSSGKITPLKYSYDSMNIFVKLNRIYKRDEPYTVYIKYIARPNGYKANISSMMEGQKGLYFINPTGEIKNKPTQIWTQGETEANSYWVPTIDKPNQKTTDEIIMTVPAKYQTLSNGLLVSKEVNKDGTRTDTWKMDLPHAPYLMFMAVGDYSIIKDSYKGKEVSYYVEPEYASVARKIFGKTPAMISLFSRLTGVDYPWQKYAQVTGRDYIFGAMENTSATLHEEGAQQDARQLVDGNHWEDIIAHELFHQWFGDYVTTESWSNATLNESFADYGEVLWNEFTYGKEEGQAAYYSDLRNYLANPSNESKPLVRFHYKNVFQAFDGVSYQKGGCILNMLRNYVGDSAFFKSLKTYLNNNKFSSAEAQNLRLAFEEVTGQDLNWFFNQWYYNNGHPHLDINYAYDAAEKKEKVFISQTQVGNVFTLPVTIDVYGNSKKDRYQVWLKKAADTFLFLAQTQPLLVNVDADKVLVCEKNDHKTATEFAFQYENAGSYIDRREAASFFLSHKTEPGRMSFFKAALKDKNVRLQRFLLEQLNGQLENDTVKTALRQDFINLSTDKNPLVKAAALANLGAYKEAGFKQLFLKATTDSSYTVAGKALEALGKIDSVLSLKTAMELLAQPSKGNLQLAIFNEISKHGTEESYKMMYDQFMQAGLNTRFAILEPVSMALGKSKNEDEVKLQVDNIAHFRDDLPAFIAVFTGEQLNGSLSAIATGQQTLGKLTLANYIRSKLPPVE